MRSTLNVTLATLLSLATACGATTAQRRNTGMVTLAAGAALFAAGAIMSQQEEEDDCPEGPSFCFDLVDENAIGSGLLMFGGGALAAGGLIGLLSAAPSEAPPPSPPSPALDADASDCIEWKRELDAEHDPARRGALHAIRPAHCPRPDVSAAAR